MLGRHRGHHDFTVGQRRGLGVAADRPLYVLGTDAERNRVAVGAPRAARARTRCGCAARRLHRVRRARRPGSPPLPLSSVGLPARTPGGRTATASSSRSSPNPRPGRRPVRPPRLIDGELVVGHGNDRLGPRIRTLIARVQGSSPIETAGVCLHTTRRLSRETGGTHEEESPKLISGAAACRPGLAGGDACRGRALQRCPNCTPLPTSRLIIDDSGSMPGTDPGKSARGSARTLSGNPLNVNKTMGGVEFGTRPGPYSPAADRHLRRAELDRRVARPRCRATAPCRRSDGVDTGGGPTTTPDSPPGTARTARANARIFLSDGAPNEGGDPAVHRTPPIKTYVVGFDIAATQRGIGSGRDRQQTPAARRRTSCQRGDRSAADGGRAHRAG